MMNTNEQEKPQMWDWYTQYYAAVAGSHANAQYCERLHGHNLCQHDFTEMAHLDKLIEVAGLRRGQRVLDVGCGNGSIAEYISDQSGTHITGLDFIPEAIRQAQERTQFKRDRLEFRVGRMGAPDFPDASFDVLVSIDTLYFTPLPETLGQMKRMLKPGGQMAIFYSYGCLPHEALETFPKAAILPDGTPLAQALQQHGLSYQTWDYTPDDYQHARRKQQLAEEFKDAFTAEGNLFLYENHAGEANGVMRAIEGGAHARYLYLVQSQK